MSNPIRRHVLCGLISLILVLIPGVSYSQCLSVGIAISHGVKTKNPKSVRAVIGAVLYEQRLDNGSIRILTGSTVAFAAGTNDTIQAKGSSSSPRVDLIGDITKTPKRVTIEAEAVIEVEGRGAVSTLVEISATGLRRKIVVRRNGQKITVLKGFTSYKVTDLSTGNLLSKGKRGRFSKLRTFRYQWKTGPCGGSGGGGGKK